MSIQVRDGIAKQISELAKEYPGLAKARDNLFVLWFLQAYVLGEETSDIDQYVCGFRGDGGIDAIFVDGQARMVHLVQGKLRQTFGKVEPSHDIDRFVRDCAIVCSADKEKLNVLLSQVNALSKEKIKQAAKRIASDGYEPRLYYVTTGKVSRQKGDRFRSDARVHIRNGILDIVGSDELEYVYPDFRDGIAPPVPLTALDVEAGSTVIDRVDPASKIRSWIFPAEVRSVSALYELCGTRLFAKNIRGYLGESTSINKAMAQTLHGKPDEFFYLKQRNHNYLQSS
ncbi:hypothetical protein [Bradyrhizobium sp. LA2.1]|uniref:hypothetical protein n=1 Tax=Bradyrhizobium sp. LA2.1 TaxID=3156376 RepID=UPI003399F5B6